MADKDNTKLIRTLEAHTAAIVRLGDAFKNLKIKEMEHTTRALISLARVLEDIDARLERSQQINPGRLTQDKDDNYGDQEAETSSGRG